MSPVIEQPPAEASASTAELVGRAGLESPVPPASADLPRGI